MSTLASAIRRPRGPGAYQVTMAFAATACLGLIAALLASTQQDRAVISDASIFSAAALAAIACSWAAVKGDARWRRGWILLGAASGLWAAGEGTGWFYEVVLGKQSAVSFADLAFTAAVPLAIIALVSFPGVPNRLEAKVRTLIDGLLITGAMVFAIWTTVVAPVLQNEAAGIAKLVQLGPPLGAVILVSLAFFVVLSAEENRAQFLMIGAGLTAFAITAGGQTFLATMDSYGGGHLIDFGWFGGYLLIALAAVRQWSLPTRRQRSAQLSFLVQVGPFLGFVLAATVAMPKVAEFGTLDAGLVWIGSGMALLIAFRQVLMVQENIVLTQKLEAKVAERTNELRGALDEVEDMRGRQDEFVSNTSHELRTPLTVILGVLRTLMRPQINLDPVAGDLVERAERNTVRMTQLVENLLAVSQLDEEKSPGRPFDLKNETREVLRGFDLAGRKLILDAPPKLPAIGNPERFRTALCHVLSNAVKFSPDGSNIRIACRESGDRAELVVADEGPGIPSNKSERVFERFLQLDGRVTRSHQGTGLGLFIARRVMRSMQGDVRVGVHEGKGATLIISLPTRRPIKL